MQPEQRTGTTRLDEIRTRASWVEGWWATNKWLGAKEPPGIPEVRNLCEDTRWLVHEHEQLREAVGSALTSLATGPAKDGYAYTLLSEAMRDV